VIAPDTEAMGNDGVNTAAPSHAVDAVADERCRNRNRGRRHLSEHIASWNAASLSHPRTATNLVFNRRTSPRRS
jgi:hypothetical protein